MDEVWKRLPDDAFAQLDQSVVEKYIPERAAQSRRPNGGKPKAAPR
jgi:hypothetical protein